MLNKLIAIEKVTFRLKNLNITSLWFVTAKYTKAISVYDFFIYRMPLRCDVKLIYGRLSIQSQ